MQYRSSSTILETPRTCPSTRLSRFSSSSFVAVYPRVVASAMVTSILSSAFCGLRDLPCERGCVHLSSVLELQEQAVSTPGRERGHESHRLGRIRSFAAGPVSAGV